MAKSVLRFVSCLAMLLVLRQRGMAQTVTGTIQGTVTDTSGGVLPGVTVTVTHVDTGTERAVVTNEAGLYTRRSSRSAATRSRPSCPASAP